MKHNIFSVCILLIILACDDKASIDESANGIYKIANVYPYNQLLDLLGDETLGGIVEQPDQDGALGRNKSGYFHVRFQLGLTSISDFAIISKRKDVLESFTQTLLYSFNHQQADGSFELSIPDDILNAPDYKTPGEGDLESGVAFFASSLGTALVSLEHSTWYTEAEETDALRGNIRGFNSNTQRVLEYLMTKKEILKQYDSHAPNRLLFDAIAYYSLGKYLNHIDAQAVGLEFMALALAMIEGDGGYFIEGGGWDSSYNGVAIKLAMELLSLMENENTQALEETIVSATSWQIGRISADGEISTEGNTRVFPGGESFLGTEKGVDYGKTVRALYYFGYLADDPSVVILGDKVLDYYQ